MAKKDDKEILSRDDVLSSLQEGGRRQLTAMFLSGPPPTHPPRSLLFVQSSYEESYPFLHFPFAHGGGPALHSSLPCRPSLAVKKRVSPTAVRFPGLAAGTAAANVPDDGGPGPGAIASPELLAVPLVGTRRSRACD